MPPKRRATTSSTQSEAKRARILVTVSGGHAQPDRLIEYYKSGKLCDIELRVAGAAFKAHRLVMAACSDTLDRQFAGAGGFSDSASATVDLPAGYTAAALEATLDFIYSGECRVDAADLGALLEAAHYLQVQPLIDRTAIAIQERLSDENALAWGATAERMSLYGLQEAATKHALGHFEELVATAEFFQMPPAFLETLLGSTWLEVQSELVVFDAVVAWIKAQSPPPGADVAGRLLKLVRYPLIPRERLERVTAEPVVTSHPDGSAILLQSFKDGYYGQRDRGGHGLATPRLGRLPQGVQLMLAPGFLDAWTKHYDEPYSHETTPDGLHSLPAEATYVFVGARDPEGRLALGAVGKRAEVLRETQNNETHEHNGVHWYFAREPSADHEEGEEEEYLSFGFSRVAQVRLSNADVLGSDHSTNTPDEDGKYRLSWHVGQGENDGGWRAGQHTCLSNSDGWRKLVYFVTC